MIDKAKTKNTRDTSRQLQVNMDQSSWIFVLLLSQMALSASEDLKYLFIKDPKTWNQAQTFCREFYTDLATVRNMKNLKELERLTEPDQGTDGGTDGGTDVWIGLHQTSDDALDPNRKWLWSQPEVQFNETEAEAEWLTGEPNDNIGAENYVALHPSNKWFDAPRDWTFTFICYNESSSSSVVIQEVRPWTEAQQFCREHHTDLISGLDQIRQFIDKYPDRSSSDYWIGLSRDSWAWSDGSDASFRNWNSDVNPLNHKCAALRAQGRWESDACDLKKPFVCHGDEKILKTLVKISLFSAVDLNSLDPELLKQEMEKKFKEKNLNVKLSWKTGKDGKIFQKQDKDKKKTKKDEL